MALVPYTKGSKRSKNAWEPVDLRLTRLHMKILKLVKGRKRGMTCDQVEAALKGLHQTISARINELVGWSYLIDTGNKRLTRSGFPARVLRSMWPSTKTARQMLLLKEDNSAKEEKTTDSPHR